MNEKYTVIYSPESLNDLRNIYSYIAFSLREPAIAQKQTERIRKEIRNLYFMPMRHEVVDWEPWHSLGIRKFPVGKYLVFYRPDEDSSEVTVIRIFYGGQNIEEIIKE